jgi:hypothetical protein
MRVRGNAIPKKIPKMYMHPSEQALQLLEVPKVCNHPDGDSRSRAILMEVEAMSSAQEICSADPEVVFMDLAFVEQV